MVGRKDGDIKYEDGKDGGITDHRCNLGVYAVETVVTSYDAEVSCSARGNATSKGRERLYCDRGCGSDVQTDSPTSGDEYIGEKLGCTAGADSIRAVCDVVSVCGCPCVLETVSSVDDTPECGTGCSEGISDADRTI